MRPTTLLVIILLSACQSQSNQKVKTYWENHTPRIIHTYDNPKDTSTFIRQAYYNNGNLFSEGLMINGIQHGTWRWWYKNGVLKDEANLDHGIYFGERKHWYPNGNPKHFEAIIGKSDKDGTCPNSANQFFYANGLLEQSDTVINGRLNGHCIYFDSITRHETHIIYKEGIPDSIYKIQSPTL